MGWGGVKGGAENGAMLTTHFFKYTSECTISQSNFQNFLRPSGKGALTNQNPADALGETQAYFMCISLMFSEKSSDLHAFGF